MRSQPGATFPSLAEFGQNYSVAITQIASVSIESSYVWSGKYKTGAEHNARFECSKSRKSGPLHFGHFHATFLFGSTLKGVGYMG